MIDRVLAFSVRQRWLVMIGVLMMGAFGAWNFTRLPIDAVPDITNVQVQINTNAPGYSPLEVEQRITFPIETAMGGLPNLVNTRSLSRYGLSQVTVVFKDGTDIYFARQLVNERVQRAKDVLPTGIETAMGPVSTGLGEIYMYTVEAKQGATRADGKPFPQPNASAQMWVPVAGGPSFLLGPNFYSVKSYNPSMNYALAICHLGDRILGGSPFIHPFHGSERALTLAEVQEMQTRLTRAGFDTGGTDGRVGNDTMKAIRDFQLKTGLSPADGYGGLKVLARLRQGG